MSVERLFNRRAYDSCIGRIGRRAVLVALVSALASCTSYYQQKTRSVIPQISAELKVPDKKTLSCKDAKTSKKEKTTYADVKNAVDQHFLSGDPEDATAYEARFRLIMKAFEASKSKHMLIYVNGGLNSKATVLKQAALQIGCMKQDGYFPVFLSWDTGFPATYIEQIAHVRNGRLKDLVQPTAPMYLLGDIGEALARAPITWANSFIRYFDSTVVRDNDEYTHAKDKIDREMRPDDFRNVRFDDAADDNAANRSFDPFDQLAYTVAAPVRAATTPFVDSIGQTSWENMVRRNRLTIHAAWEFQPEFRNPELPHDRAWYLRCYPKGMGTFARFFQDLDRHLNNPTSGADCLSQEPAARTAAPQSPRADHKAKITLIGHSMGTIVLDALIPEFPALPYRNVVYMAAATSLRNFEHSVVPAIIQINRKRTADRADKVRFYNLMLYPLYDSRERVAYGLAPSGSLLEWIDDMYENPKTMIDRTFGMWRNIREARFIFPRAFQDVSLFKIFGYKKDSPSDRFCGDNGTPTNPDTHGSFNDIDKCYWRPTFWGDDNSRM